MEPETPTREPKMTEWMEVEEEAKIISNGKTFWINDEVVQNCASYK